MQKDKTDFLAGLKEDIKSRMVEAYEEIASLVETKIKASFKNGVEVGRKQKFNKQSK